MSLSSRSLRLRIILVGVLPLIVAGGVVTLLASQAFNDYGKRRDKQLVQTLRVQSHAVGRAPIAPQMLAGMNAGWTQSIDKMEELVARSK